MLEIEMKCPVAEFTDVQRRLAAWTLVPHDAHAEADHYFNAPDRDFAQTDEALRLRRIAARNVVTYKGPKQATTAKTRLEVEVSLADGDEAAQDFIRLVQLLGYRPVAIVHKQRVCYHLERRGFALEITLDEVEQVGRFVEVEIRAPEDQRQAAQKILLDVLAELELTITERRSYLEMLLARSA